MQDVSENIPSDLQPRVEAALAWFNASAGSDELRLILCGGHVFPKMGEGTCLLRCY